MIEKLLLMLGRNTNFSAEEIEEIRRKKRPDHMEWVSHVLLGFNEGFGQLFHRLHEDGTRG